MRLNKDFLIPAVAALLYFFLSFWSGFAVHLLQTLVALTGMVFLIRGLIRAGKKPK